MLKKPKKPKQKPKKTFSIAETYGYTRKDFKQWGKLGGRSLKYVSHNPLAEAAKAYRRRKACTKLLTTTGILSMKTGRISKYRTNAERQRAYRLRKKTVVY
jgi:hypothetical protein